VSEELENSLQQAIETYFGQRLHAIEEQISQLQEQFNEALTRLRENAKSESLNGTPLSASIFAHFQTARSQQLTGAASLQALKIAEQIAAIKRAVEQIEQQQTQSEVLSTLLISAAQFAERVALFVIRNEQAIGWRVCEASDPTNLETIRGFALALSTDTLLSEAARSRSSWAGTPESHSGNRALIEQLGGNPQTLAVVPLIVRGKVVALLYADSSSTDPDAIRVDSIDLLVHVASMAVALSGGHHTQPAPAVEHQTAPAPAVAETETAAPAEASIAEAATEIQPASSYVPEVEAQAPRVFVEPTVEPIDEQAVPDEVKSRVAESFAETPAEAVTEPDHAEQLEPVAAAEVPKATEFAPEIETTAPTPETQPAPEMRPDPTPSTSAFDSHYAAPLGSARRYGITEPELPIEVGEDERRLHNDARRFARLLVSEIKLYNEPKVREGRNNGDLYDRLREDIDRSRQMYDKRVAPPVAARHDYFHQELVNTLAEGDPAKLGSSYPGDMASNFSQPQG
jgi:hypothetical protein